MYKDKERISRKIIRIKKLRFKNNEIWLICIKKICKIKNEDNVLYIIRVL
jgi:hypothetical protein